LVLIVRNSMKGSFWTNSIPWRKMGNGRWEFSVTAYEKPMRR
jgi:hypothetical protein